MSLIELLGIIENSKALNTVGTFLRWYEILALAGIVFAISEFMGHSKLRNYIFKWSNLSKYFYMFSYSFMKSKTTIYINQKFNHR
ncbi:hypothetical protein ES705_43547 [subsurface metagenome]